MKFAPLMLAVLAIMAGCDPGVESTICRSQKHEDQFRALAKGTVSVLAVCPKKGLYFVELFGDDHDVSRFKELLMASDLKVIEVTDSESETSIGSKVIKVHFSY